MRFLTIIWDGEDDPEGNVVVNRKIVKRVVRNAPVSREEADRLNEIRRQAMEEFPPVQSPPGVASQVREARRATKMTWQAVADAAGIVDAAKVRDIEHGRDVQVSDLEAVAHVLGLRLELVAIGK